MTTLTQERLKEVLHYSPETGVFTRRVSTSSRAQAGDVPGCINGCGYWQAMIDSNLYLSHRLAWLYIYGCFPENEIDHINGDRSDNRIENIRDVTRAENNKNLTISTTNSSGVIGVCWDKATQKWHSQIQYNGKRVNLGLYEDLELAGLVRKEAEIKYGYHANHGKAGQQTRLPI